MQVDSRGQGWSAFRAEAWINEARERGTPSGVRFNQPPYSERCPNLATILDYDPDAPSCSLIARNVFQKSVRDEVDKETKPFVQFQGNLLDADPRFVDSEHGDFQLRDDSPA